MTCQVLTLEGFDFLKNEDKVPNYASSFLIENFNIYELNSPITFQ